MTGGAGLVVASTRRAHEGGYETHEPYFIRGAARTTVEGIYASSATGEPALTVATPLRDERGRRVGVLAAHVDLDRLRMVLLDRRGLGESGETYFVDEFNNFVSPPRFGRRDLPRGVHTEGIDRALAGRSGAGRYRNYAGEDVIGVYRWVPSRRVASSRSCASPRPSPRRAGSA